MPRGTRGVLCCHSIHTRNQINELTPHAYLTSIGLFDVTLALKASQA